MKNQLKNEDSPYLKQHENNPVKWLPWNKFSLEKAKNENKLIFLSIGYSTCHWCHVMAHESFENEKIALFLNENYVCIKVDREEMPHVDKHYQDIHYLLQKRAGGWPLSVFLMPDSSTIFAATYIPPKSRNDMLGFYELINFLQDKFMNDKDELIQSSNSILKAHERYINHRQKPLHVDIEVVNLFVNNVESDYDSKYHGIGNTPKFPHASTLDVLLDIYALTKNEKALQIVQETAFSMSKGGICDQIEGGFYRYSVDRKWQIPHFEKMLYTNAELLSLYARIYKFTKEDIFKESAENIVEAIKERFLDEGVYFSASDADSEGEEGKYFVFDFDKAFMALKNGGFSENESVDVLNYFNITKLGNFENNSSNPFISNKKMPKNLKLAKNILKKLRQQVDYPFIDKKILTSWNALFISGLFDAGKYVDEIYTKMALLSLDKILKILYVDGVLYHQIIKGSSLKVFANLEDYAFLSDALLQGYENSLDEKYIKLTKIFVYESINRFYINGRWYLNDDELKSSAPQEDTSYRSAVSRMMGVMTKILLFENDLFINQKLEEMMMLCSGNLAKFPHAYPELLRVWLKLYKGEILLKTPRNMKKEIIEKLVYPYTFVIECEDKYIEACSKNSCFAKEKSLKDVINKIKNLYM